MSEYVWERGGEAGEEERGRESQRWAKARRLWSKGDRRGEVIIGLGALPCEAGEAGRPKRGVVMRGSVVGRGRRRGQGEERGGGRGVIRLVGPILWANPAVSRRSRRLLLVGCVNLAQPHSPFLLLLFPLT